MEETEINLLDFWRVLWKNRFLIIGLFFVISIVTLIVSLRLPKIYKATASLLRPTESSRAIGALGSQMLLPLGLAGQSTASDVFLAILKSRSVADQVVDRFGLQEIYKSKKKEDARLMLAKNTTIGISKDKVIEVSVLDKDPKRAAEIANFYVASLDGLNRTLNITSAGEKKRFIEKRLEETRADLKEAEENLKAYQVSHKIETDGGAAKTAGGLQGNLIAARVDLEAKKKYATSLNPEIIKAQNQVAALEKAISSLPPLAVESARFIRALEVQKTVYSLLINQYEEAKIEEARDTSTVQVLDWAVTPERKFKPNIRHNLAVSCVLALVLGVFLSFLKEYNPHKR